MSPLAIAFESGKRRSISNIPETGKDDMVARLRLIELDPTLEGDDSDGRGECCIIRWDGFWKQLTHCLQPEWSSVLV